MNDSRRLRDMPDDIELELGDKVPPKPDPRTAAQIEAAQWVQRTDRPKGQEVNLATGRFRNQSALP